MYKEIEGLNELDNKIIEILEMDARRSYTEIAEEVSAGVPLYPRALYDNGPWSVLRHRICLKFP